MADEVASIFNMCALIMNMDRLQISFKYNRKAQAFFFCNQHLVNKNKVNGSVFFLHL